MSRFGPPRRELATFIELFALSGLLIAQPVFDFLGKNGRELTVLRLSLQPVLAFVLIVLLVPPAVVLAVEIVIGLVSPRARRWLHIAVMAVAIGVIAGNYVKVATHLGAALRVAASIVVGLAVGFYIIRSTVPQQWLRFLAIAPLIFALLFVTASPASILLFQDAKAAKATIARPARVIMIVFDEFPEESLLDGTGHIDSQLFPNLAKLAADSTWYRNDTTVAEFTGRAVPAILTGKYPPINSELPISSKYPQSLFTLLGKTYKMHAHEFYEQLCPVSMCTEPTSSPPLHNLLKSSSLVMHNLMDLNRASWDQNKGFRFGFDSPPGFEPGLTVAQNFLRSLQPATQPTLDYLHVLIPHQPWEYFGAGKDRGIGNPSIFYFLPSDYRKIGLAREMHLLNVQATDWYLGEVMNKLKAIGAYDNSLIVVTADHGVYFPYRRDTSPDDYDSIMWTPLFIKAPHQGVGQETPGRIDDQPTRSIDVLPTIAAELGVKIPWKIDGVSALGPRRAPGPVPIIRNDIGRNGLKRTYDGRAGFAKVLRSRAAPAVGDPALRLYRIGLYGNLIGESAASLVRGAPMPLKGLLYTPGGWNNVDVNANTTPWANAGGSFAGIPSRTIAITVNGRIAGLAVITNGGHYYALLVPQFFHNGHNDVRAFLVAGPKSSAVLAPISPVASP